ncbi:hypothetical protein M408DRAFT_18974 [Serendipita vermifera MAFF 305830]|uniref:DUF7330 domain-containing protein n=1 Tax=Serendipita vermifera MAFF 305830 TaxID=933852 RepID=A0A0C3BB18_SERVB|nr:hypothetical protein M408DRAFT_18974 [Serendipita vermifera MAFF 305830]
MFEISPKRLAASISKRKPSVCGFHTSRPSTFAPLPKQQNTPSSTTLASRLFSNSIKKSVQLDRLGVSLALPVPLPLNGLSDIAILTLSAALRLRTDLAPIGLGFDTSNLQTRMLIEDKSHNNNESVATSDKHPILDVDAGTSVPPPAYSKDDVSGSKQEEPYNEGDPNELPAATNFAHIYRRDGRIRGRWNIDPTMAIPAALLPKEDGDARKGPFAALGLTKSDDKAEEHKDEPMPNLKLHTRDGRIHADVTISGTPGDKPSKTPTLLDIYTRDGGIVLRVRTRGPAPLHMKVYTHDGAVRVFLPRTFNGLLTHKLRDGSVIASPAMQKPGGITTFTSVDGATGRSFVGEWRGLLDQAAGSSSNADKKSDELAADSWTGDRCDVTSRDGNAYFYWEDEYEEVMSKLTATGWIKSLFAPR